MIMRTGMNLKRRLATTTARAVVAVAMATGVAAAGYGVAGASTTSLNCAPSGLGSPVAAGTVSVAPSGSAFSITTRHGATIVVNVTSTTSYTEHGVSSPTLTNVTIGELVAVFGTSSGSSVSATEVVIWAPRSGLGTEPAIAGTVSVAPSGLTFSVLTRGGTTYVVTASSTTTYTEKGVTAPTIANVTLGERVAVFGTTTANSVAATGIAIRAADHGFATAGTVATLPDSLGTFTITAWGGTTITVTTSPTTAYAAEGIASPTIADVKVGLRVGIFGSLSGATVSATQVDIEEPPLAHANFATAGLVTTAPVGPAPTSFVITSWSKTPITVNVATTTTFVEYGVTAPTLANVTAGEFVGIVGTLSGTTATATQIVITGSESHGLLGCGEGHGHHRGFGDGGFGWGSGFGPGGHHGRSGSGGGYGVSGTATGPNGNGVSGTSTGPNGNGVSGTSMGPDGFGVSGTSTGPNGWGGHRGFGGRGGFRH